MEKPSMYYQYMYSYPHKSAYHEMEEGSILKAINSLKNENTTLYIHVPFCSSKCGYCNLFSIPTKQQDLIEAYVEALCRQIVQYSNLISKSKIQISDLVIGGGTPLIFSKNQMEKIFRALEENLFIDIKKINFIIETSPNETQLDKILYLKEKGVNRISIGIQSFVEDELKSLYRNHRLASCESALDNLKKTGIDCLNIDLIYGIEGQTIESLTYSINKALSYSPEEIFIYPLYVREHTGLYNKMKVDSKLQYEMYQQAAKELKCAGYTQTSMRRFVRNKPEKNISCGFEQMIALGCGGRSYIGNVHFCEPYESDMKICRSILKEYIEKRNFLQGLKGYILNEDEMERRFIIKNLGYYKGIDIEEYKQYFNHHLFKQYPLFQELLTKKLVQIDENRVKFTGKGMGYADMILALWISEEVKKRMNKC